MVLNQRPDRLERYGGDVLDPEDRVRVAHVDDARRPIVGEAGRDQRDLAFVVDGLRQRDLVPGQARPPHVDAVGPFVEPLAGDDAGRGLDREGARAADARQSVGDAARAVAAGARLAAVVVVDADERFRPRRRGSERTISWS